VKFIVDNQSPPAPARLIQSDFGGEAMHVADLGLRDATDSELWAYALNVFRPLFEITSDNVMALDEAHPGRSGAIDCGLFIARLKRTGE
jgi:predicted nuclease of predicted toxin-antitoxin system